jgi:glycosyltransferase involved in cell wall biosynthesis
MLEEQPVSNYISIIIPAYNEEARLPKTLEQIAAFLQTQTYSYEVIVVENGSIDRTLEVAEEFAAEHDFIQVIQSAKGKGEAVRAGMLTAKGSYRFMCDADLSMPIDELPRFFPPKGPAADVVIGSRGAEGAVRYNEPSNRHWGGRMVNLVIRLLALPGLWDTQCGFKNFSAQAAEDLFLAQTVMGWSFDIEILFIARMRGYTVAELGIPWYYSPESHVSPVKDAIKMLLDILKIRMNAWRGVYAKKKV